MGDTMTAAGKRSGEGKVFARGLEEEGGRGGGGGPDLLIPAARYPLA